MPSPRVCLSRSLPLACACVCAGKFARNLKLCYAEKKEAMQMQSPHMATGCAAGGKGEREKRKGDSAQGPRRVARSGFCNIKATPGQH